MVLRPRDLSSTALHRRTIHRWCVSITALVSIGTVVGGCGQSSHREPASVTDTVRAFYTAALRDQDYRRACRVAAPHFYLRGSTIGGSHVDSRRAVASQLKARVRPDRHGDCVSLVQEVVRKRRAEYPFSAWTIERVRISGRSAEVVTTDGSSGLERVGRTWRVSWVFG